MGRWSAQLISNIIDRVTVDRVDKMSFSYVQQYDVYVS